MTSKKHQFEHPPVPEPSVRAALLRWYRANKRDLPWRHRTQDPYAVWISEIMLQQTRVDTVIPYYERFLERWPNVESLAAADPEDVRAAWSGLGYYRRAALMLRAANSVVTDHGGQFPSRASDLQKLPGFGRYTAGAVASIAFDEAAPAVDGNTARVLARLAAIRGPLEQADQQKALWALASELCLGESPGDFTQAMIELGALVCLPKSPQCDRCPVSSSCEARAQGLVEDIPPPKKRVKKQLMKLTALLIRKGDLGILLERRAEGGLLAGLWCLPLLEGHLDAESLGRTATSVLGLETRGFIDRGRVKHILTHREISMRIIETEAKPPKNSEILKWVNLKELSKLGIPTVTARALKAALPKEVLSRIELPTRTRMRGGA